MTFKTFFEQATLNPNANLIKGVICGYRVEEIETPLTKQVRYLDKVVDELAKGKKMEKNTERELKVARWGLFRIYCAGIVTIEKQVPIGRIVLIH